MLAAEAARHCFEAERADQQRQPKLRTARPIMPPSSPTAVVADYTAKESRFTGKINWVQLTSVLTTASSPINRAVQSRCCVCRRCSRAIAGES
jgi:hypothetical protein